MQVDKLMVNEGSQIYYTDLLRDSLEDFMTLFRTDSSTQPMNIDPGLAQRFYGDLSGLLTFLRVPAQFHYAIMRVNKMNSPDEYRPTMLTLLTPDTGEIQRIMQTENSVNRSNT